ncbi:DUF4136 domain-containing protein [Jiulongibacter sediminis]|nr:DUF4136 domain-containing protein [Jiulongibacter sediminis]
MKTLFTLLTGLLLLLSGCSPSLWIDQEPNIIFENYKTYAWNTLEDRVGHTYYNKENIDESVKSSIESSLSKQGFTKVEADKANVYLDFHVYIEENYFQEAYCPTGFYGNLGYQPDLSPGPRCEVPERQRIYDSGTFVIDMIDKNSGQLVWRASSFDVVSNPIDLPTILKKRARNMIKKYGR